MKRMAWPRIAIDAAMFTPAIGIDRTVKRNVWRRVARDDRLGLFNRNAGAQARRIPIKQSAIIKPIAIGLPRIQIKPRWRDPTRRPASGGEGRGWL